MPPVAILKVIYIFLNKFFYEINIFRGILYIKYISSSPKNSTIFLNFLRNICYIYFFQFFALRISCQQKLVIYLK